MATHDLERAMSYDDSKKPYASSPGITPRHKDFAVVTEGWSDRGLVGATKRLMLRCTDLGAEARGIHPISLEERTPGRGPLINMMTIWLSPNSTILTFSLGTLGPAIFGMNARDSCLTILFFNLLSNMLPAYLGTWGPKMGLRQMTIARYSFGYYGVAIACILNLIGMFGFCMLNAVSGGQALSATSGGDLSWTVGIVVIAIIALFVSFMGFRVLHAFERYAWIVINIMFIIMAGLSGKHLHHVWDTDLPSASAGAVLSFGSTVMGYGMTWASLASDYSAYLPPETSGTTLFAAMYAGINLPLILIQSFGACAYVAMPFVPDWQAGYDADGLGGLLDAMLAPAGNFGKFCLGVLAIGICTNNAPTIYSCGLTLQTLLPFLSYIPRFLLSLVVTGIYLPIAIVVATRFNETLNNFLACLGYWIALYGAILITEHYLFRGGKFSNYDVSAWNSPRLLPAGIAAFAAGMCACGPVAVSMAQVWWTGPLALAIPGHGDVGIELGFATAAILYAPFRYLERRCFGH